jgi:altronate dehydratase small subunit
MEVSTLPATCFQIHANDNVATLLEDSEPGSLAILGQSGTQPMKSVEPVQLGHKVALFDIAEGDRVIKFGVPIGVASRPIRAGQWVHLHNCRSNFDERSGTLDLHSGAATDTRYE